MLNVQRSCLPGLALRDSEPFVSGSLPPTFKLVTRASCNHKPQETMIPNGVGIKDGARASPLIGGTYDAATTAARKSFTLNSSLARKTKAHRLKFRKAFGHVPKQVSSDLSLRQMQILGLLCQGKTMRQISRCLGLRYETVRTHLKRSYKKLKVVNRTAAIVAFLKNEEVGNQTMRSSVKFCPSCGCNFAITKMPARMTTSESP